jgi:hypothetical protein
LSSNAGRAEGLGLGLMDAAYGWVGKKLAPGGRGSAARPAHLLVRGSIG